MAFGRKLRNQAIILGAFVALIWFLELVDWLILDGSLDALGVRPRSLDGLKGIIFMPFLHSGMGHLLANTIPFIVLGAVVMVRRTSDIFLVAAVTIVVSGLGVWLFGGSNSVHIGASGLIFGFFGFILLRAYFEWSMGYFLLAAIVAVMYSGLIWGVLPTQAGVSWQGHLFGFIGGVLAAYLLSKRQKKLL